MLPELQKGLAAEAEPRPVAFEILVHQRGRKDIVTGRHRSMRGEDSLLPDAPDRLLGGDAALHLLAQQLEREEGGVSLVRMPDGRPQSERARDAYAADAQENFLAQPSFLIAAIESGRQLAVGRRIFGNVG